MMLATFAGLVCVVPSLAQTTLRFRFKEGDKATYVVDTKDTMTISAMGMMSEAKMAMTFEVTWTILKVDSQGNGTVQFKFNSAKISMDGPLGKVEADSKDTKEPDDPLGKAFNQIVKVMAATEAKGVMAPTGELKDVEISKETLEGVKKLAGAEKFAEAISPDAIKSNFGSLVFPKEEISKGKSWSHKVESKTPSMGKTIIDYAYTYEGPVKKDSGTLERISVKPSVKMEADPASKFKFEVKDSKGNGEILFDNKMGRLVESTAQLRVEMSIDANGMTGSQTLEQTITIRAKK